MSEELSKFPLKKECEKWLKTDKDIQKTMKNLDEYIDNYYSTMPVKIRKHKVFYHYIEWEGWRFYKKALFYGDFRSIWSHIKSKLNL